MIFGGREKLVRGGNTIKALKCIYKLNFIEEIEYKKLKKAYIFLRNLENMVQISFGLQTHDLPEDRLLLGVLALKMNINGNSIEELTEKLNNEFSDHTQSVSNIFSALFKKEQDRKLGNKIRKMLLIKNISEN